VGVEAVVLGPAGVEVLDELVTAGPVPSLQGKHSADHTYRVTEEQFSVAFQEEWTWNATRKQWR
jgi:hypothetical protein